MKNLFDIQNKVVVITGGTGILGRAIAAHLAEEGAKVVILGRKAEIGNEIVNAIKEKGGEAMFLVTDVSGNGVITTVDAAQIAEASFDSLQAGTLGILST